MRILLFMLLSFILTSILSYFCFLHKAETIKEDLLLQSYNLYSNSSLENINMKIKGEELKLTRDLLLTGQVDSQNKFNAVQQLFEKVKGLYSIDNQITIQDEILATENSSKKQKNHTPITPTNTQNTNNSQLCQESIKLILSKEKINFSYNSAEISVSSYPALDKIVMILNECSTSHITIEGHTDSDGKAEYNKILSQKRADSVKNFLESQGVSSARLTSIGYGESKPLLPNISKENKSKNRRIELKIKGVK